MNFDLKKPSKKGQNICVCFSKGFTNVCMKNWNTIIEESFGVFYMTWLVPIIYSGVTVDAHARICNTSEDATAFIRVLTEIEGCLRVA